MSNPITEQLAIDGGPKAVRNKLIAWPQFDDKAIQAVDRRPASGKVNYWTGRRGMEFEKQVRRVAGQQVRRSASPTAPPRCTWR